MTCTYQGIDYPHILSEISSKLLEDKKRKIKTNLKENLKNGPNVNLKLPRGNNYTQEEKEWFEKKLRDTKKTELCKNWVLYKDCFYRNNCSFAHGENELRVKKIEKNKKYKTKICNVFIEEQYCSFGSRCQYRHIMSEKRLFKFSFLNYKLANDVNQEITIEENQDYSFMNLLNLIENRSNLRK